MRSIFELLSAGLVNLRGPTRPWERGACCCCCWLRGGRTWQAPWRRLRLHGWPWDWAWGWRRHLPCVDLRRRDVVLGVLQLLQLLHDLGHCRPILAVVADALQGDSSDSMGAFLRVLPSQFRVHDAVQTALVSQVGFCPFNEVLLGYRFRFV